MSDSGLNLRFMVDFWGSLAQQVGARMQTASEEISDRTYTPGKMLSDAIALWMAPMQTWFDAFSASVSAPVPLVLFRVNHNDPKTSVKRRAIRLHPPVSEEPESSALYRLGGGAAIPSDHVRLKLAAGGRVLHIGLRDLRTANPQPGLYAGIVSVAERPLAVLQVLVST